MTLLVKAGSAKSRKHFYTLDLFDLVVVVVVVVVVNLLVCLFVCFSWFPLFTVCLHYFFFFLNWSSSLTDR